MSPSGRLNFLAKAIRFTGGGMVQTVDGESLERRKLNGYLGEAGSPFTVLVYTLKDASHLPRPSELPTPFRR